MATSGTIKGICDNKNYTLTCSWSVTQSETSSTITAKVYLKAPSGWSTFSDYWKCTINGVQVTNNLSTWVKGSKVLLGQRTWTVNHGSDGTCSTNISFSYSNGLSSAGTYTTKTGSGSETVVLNSVSGISTPSSFVAKKQNIILYEHNETNFDHNGICILRPIECIITRNLIDYVYELDMKYPLDDTGYWSHIIEDRIIKANGQLFRIVQTDVSVIDATVTVYAKHVFFDLQKNFIEKVEIKNKSGNTALGQLLSSTAYTHDFKSYSDLSETKSFTCESKNVLDALLGEEDSFIQHWGGEVEVDNFTVNIVKQLGVDRGYKIKYGKNLTGLMLKTDYSTLITRIKPVGFDGIDLGTNKYVDSSNIKNYCMPIIKEIKYEHVKWTGSKNYKKDDVDEEDSVFTTLSLAQAELARLATLEFTEKEVDLPSVTCEVNFVELANTEEYSHLKGLEKISLGDVVMIEHQPLGINLKARCIGFTYDCLKQQYEEITIGHYQKNFFKETANTTNKVTSGDLNIAEKLETTYSQAINSMSNMMTNAMNGNVVLSNNEILIMDTDNKETATKVWRFNSSGIAYSDSGYDGDYKVGITMDGRINGALITTGTIKGEMLEVGTVTMDELAISIRDTINSSITESDAQAIVNSSLDKFESELSQNFVTQENVTKQIQSATEVAVEQATSNIINNAVSDAMENVNDQLNGKLDNYTSSVLNPTLQNAIENAIEESKDYITEVNSNYYTKGETDSKISQTKESILLGVSETYETKADIEVKITEAIEGVTVGTINRVFGTAEEKSVIFTGIANESWEAYDCATDFTDKDIVISFEYDFEGTVENGSVLSFQPYYLSVSNSVTYSPTIVVFESNETKTLNITNQLFSAQTKIHAIKQNFKFRFKAVGVSGTFTIRKAQIKVGSKITEWSIAPEDIESNANNYTIQQLINYYNKTTVDSKISALRDEITLGVSNRNETLTEISDKINNLTIGGHNLARGTRDFIKDDVIREVGFEYSLNDYTISTEDKFTVIKASSKGMTNDNIKSCYSSFIPCQKGDVFTVSVLMKIDDIDAWDMKIPYIWEVSNLSQVRIEHKEVSIIDDDSNKPVVENGKWVKMVSTHTIASDNASYCNVRLTLFKNGDISFKQLQVEKGNIATDWSPSPYDIEYDSNTYTKNQLAKYYTKEEANAEINITKDSIINTVEKTYMSKLEFEDLEIGGENLIVNSNFNYGFACWEGYTDIYYLTSNNALAYDKTDLTASKNYSIYTEPIDVKDFQGQNITLSFFFNIVSTSNQTDKKIAYIRFFTEQNKNLTTQASALSYQDIEYSDDYENSTTVKNITTIEVPSKAYYCRVGVHQTRNGNIQWRNFQLEAGNVSTSWKPNLQDSLLYTNQTITQISDELNDLSEIISSTLNSDSITSDMKVKLISEYNDAMSVYNRLSNMYVALGDTSFQSLPDELQTAKDDLEITIDSLKSTINEISESGLNNVLNKFNKFYEVADELNQAISGSLMGYSQETRTRVEQLTDSFNITVSDVTMIGEKVNDLTTSFVFDTDGLVIKSTENATKYIKLDNDSLDFMDNNNMVAQISDEQLLITNAEVENEMRIGSIRIKPSGVGGIMFIYEE